MIKHVAVALLAFGMAFGITLPKLYKMCQIKLWIPGAVLGEERITQKWHQTPAEHPKGRNVYWISWGDTPIREVGAHRTNIEREQWESLRVGALVETVRIPGDPSPYLRRNDIFVSPGNFAFDFALLGVELFFGVSAIRNLLRLRGASNAA